MAAWLAPQYLLAAREKLSTTTASGRLELLRTFLHDWTLLRRGDHLVANELHPEDAPITVENFLRYADEGFFDGLVFHRIVPGFVIQGGDPNSKDEDPGNDGMGGGQTDLSTVDEAAQTLKFSLAALESWRSGKAVTI